MKLANPAPLGLTGFALTTWMLSMVNVGWFTSACVPLVLASAFAFGGTAQFVAGIMEVPRGNTFGFVAFCAYGAFWWSFALFVQFFATNVPVGFVGWWLLMWGAFTFYMWLGSLALNRAAKSCSCRCGSHSCFWRSAISPRCHRCTSPAVTWAW